MKKWDLLAVMRTSGCEEQCASNVHLITPGDVKFFHENFSKRKLNEQNQWMLEYLHINGSSSNSKLTVAYSACGKTVCRTLWLEILGVSLNRFRRICNHCTAGTI